MERDYVRNNVAWNVRKVKAQHNPPRFLSHDELNGVFGAARDTVL